MDPLIQTGRTAPGFTLHDLSGKLHTLEQQRGRIVILNFTSAECPWSERADQLAKSWCVEWGNQVMLWSIASNAQETIEQIQEMAANRELPVVLLDPAQQVADLYGAQTTPHVFVIDPRGILRYQGSVDDVTFRQRTPQRYYLQEAVDALLADQLPALENTPPYGCMIVRLEA
jgi:peroxiredoxin